MTALDPSHIPVPFGDKKKTPWGQATYETGSRRHQGPVHLPKIPELRFEQSYLLSIKPFIHQEGEAPERIIAGEHDKPLKGKGNAQALIKEGVLPSESIYGVPIRIDWQQVAWVTIRDQVISPLVQGAVWGTAAIFLIPPLQNFVRNLFGRSPSVPSSASKQVAPPMTTQEVGPWRRWIGSWLGAVETNVALAR